MSIKVIKLLSIISSLVLTLLSASFSNIAIAQINSIDISAFNSKPIVETYTNQTVIKNKPVFDYKEGSTGIKEFKEHGNSNRDINIKSSFIDYSLSRPMNGAISDQKSNRSTSVRLFKF